MKRRKQSEAALEPEIVSDFQKNEIREDEEELNIDPRVFTENEKEIAEAHIALGRIQSLGLVQKVVTVANLVSMKKIKDSKYYRHIEGVGTWKKFCESLGLSRRTMDNHLINLEKFGEDFLATLCQFSLTSVQLRKLRHASDQGQILIDDEGLSVDGKLIPIDQDHAEDIKAEVFRIIEEKERFEKERARLLREKDSIVREETKTLETEKAALITEVNQLKARIPGDRDPDYVEKCGIALEGATNVLIRESFMILEHEWLKDNPTLVGEVAACARRGLAAIDRAYENMKDFIIELNAMEPGTEE